MQLFVPNSTSANVTRMVQDMPWSGIGARARIACARCLPPSFSVIDLDTWTWPTHGFRISERYFRVGGSTSCNLCRRSGSAPRSRRSSRILSASEKLRSSAQELSKTRTTMPSRGRVGQHMLSVPHDASLLAINQHVPNVGLKHCTRRGSMRRCCVVPSAETKGRDVRWLPITARSSPGRRNCVSASYHH